MKKLALALVCFASVAFFASCTKPVENPEPTIAVMTGENYITGTVDEPTIIDYTDENAINLKYGFHAEANSETKKELKNLVIIFDLTAYEDEGPVNEVYYDTIDLSGKTSYDYEEYLFTQEKREIITLMEGTIKAVVTDVDNQSSTASIAFVIEMEEIPVPLIGYTIEWKREGQTVVDAEEMAEYGLQWTGTYKAPFATIKPLNDDVILYVLEDKGDEFDEIQFLNDKYAYFTNLAETATPAESYRHIDANQSADYNDLLAVVYGEDLFLIRINHATINYIPGVRTDITIEGDVK